jgi:hypothetical protein
LSGDPLTVSPAKGTLSGADAGLQLVVDARQPTGHPRDLTAEAKYSATPAGVVHVDSTGYVTPLADGEAVITASDSSGASATAAVSVSGMQRSEPVNFPNQIEPIFTKHGCNAGGCHGKLSGQNGFRLSLLGFAPQDDYDYLVKEDRGRRMFPAAAEKSLLLLKATNTVAHGGGARIEVGSPEYRLIHRWISQGMPYGSASDPKVEKLVVSPRQRTMERKSQQQLSVQAHYTDGTVQDVTRMAQFDVNFADMAETSKTGLMKTQDLTGEVAVMVRYQGLVDVFRASIPLGIKVEKTPPERNFIDQAVFGKLKSLGIPPSEVCDDSTFLRRVTLDIVGRLPTVDEAQAFLTDTSADKRAKMIDGLLDSADYADFFANKWSAVLRNKRVEQRHQQLTYAFHDWIRENFRENRPFDQFVRDLLTATGDVATNPAVAWYRSVPTASDQLEDTAQLFLGLRIQCAKCHHHPFDKWAQDDYYGFAAFFSRVGRKDIQFLGQDVPRIVHNRGEAQATNPRTNKKLTPTGLGDKPIEISPEEDPRGRLVDWMVDPSNPYFARALANRYWKHFLGRGIVEPEDDMRVTNPASNPELLDALARHFADSKYDLKAVIRAICNSSTYQLSAEPNEHNARDKQNFSRYYPKRLSAEVLYDAVSQVTDTTTGLNCMPSGFRAVQLPDNGFDNYFLQVFGKPQNESACECERSSDATLAQTLHLLNSREVQDKLTNGNGRAAHLAREKDRSARDKIRELYLAVFSREPRQDELQYTLNYLARVEFKDQPSQPVEDILWALVNSKEFLFNH